VTTGLLLCDHIPNHLQDIQGDYDEMYASLLSGINVKTYFVCDGVFPSDVNECDSWLIGGSRRSVYEKESWIRRLFDMALEIHEKRIKAVGICFGHQLFAQAAGGAVRRSENGWCLGNCEFNVPDSAALMGAPQHFRMLMLCRDQVTRLPEKAILFAQHEKCVNAGFLLGSHCLCIQGHPEFSNEYLEAVIKDRKGIIPESVANAALQSLLGKTDHHIISNWLRNHLLSK
jgi:GMP synthase (glutamine-hydrolysing)